MSQSEEEITPEEQNEDTYVSLYVDSIRYSSREEIIRIDLCCKRNLLHFSKIPGRKELWTNFNNYVVSLFCTLQYHFRYGMI
jgi:hypothetical protein